MKNADAGAVWMLAAMTGDSLLRHGRLPYIRNFKLMQQGGHGDRNRGAALGQYYLSKKGAFVEEWGNHIEPIGITYYTLIDIGNILLFEPQDTLLREKLREGADLLLSLQHPDGGFDVAYDKLTGKALFTDLEDLRPTFYGLLVAHRILGERKYLDAALRGADWYVGHAVDRGRFLGVCGDAVSSTTSPPCKVPRHCSKHTKRAETNVISTQPSARRGSTPAPYTPTRGRRMHPSGGRAGNCATGS